MTWPFLCSFFLSNGHKYAYIVQIDIASHFNKSDKNVRCDTFYSLLIMQCSFLVLDSLIAFENN